VEKVASSGLIVPAREIRPSLVAVRAAQAEADVALDGQVGKQNLRAGVVSLPKGAWMKSSLNGRTSTALTPSNVNVVGGGACFNDARVQVAVRS
jgi:hypothetical protein